MCNVLAVTIKGSFGVSVHKAQGATISKGFIDASRIFDKGQFYVSLSRAKTWEGVILRHFRSSCIETSKTMV